MIEIERKFLVRTLPGNLTQCHRTDIAQGYLAYDPRGVEVRIRKANDAHCLTVKRKCADGREEHNVLLSSEEWAELWSITAGHRLFKVRYDVPHEDLVIEVDVFQGQNAGVIVAEVEFPDVERARSFIPPEWFGEEVTGNPDYSNRRRAVE